MYSIGAYFFRLQVSGILRLLTNQRKCNNHEERFCYRKRGLVEITKNGHISMPMIFTDFSVSNGLLEVGL